MPEPPTAEPCPACEETISGPDWDVCTTCGRAFHLAQTTTRPARDCGRVWINDAQGALQFACDRCLAAARTEAV